MRSMRLPLALCLAAFAGAAQAQGRLLEKRETVRLDAVTHLEIRHVDPAKFDINASTGSNPRIHVQGFYRNHLVQEFDIRGDKGWLPWGFDHVSIRDADGDGAKDALLSSFCHYGGSGEALYLTIVARHGTRFDVIDLPYTAQENIQTGEFFLARDARGGPGIVVTHPLMDGESRADPTRWEILSYRISAGKAIRVAKNKTARRYGETVPQKAILPCLPPGWKLNGSTL